MASLPCLCLAWCVQTSLFIPYMCKRRRVQRARLCHPGAVLTRAFLAMPYRCFHTTSVYHDGCTVSQCRRCMDMMGLAWGRMSMELATPNAKQNGTLALNRRVKESKSRRVEESKSQRVKESKSQRVKESKSQRVKSNSEIMECTLGSAI